MRYGRAFIAPLAYFSRSASVAVAGYIQTACGITIDVLHKICRYRSCAWAVPSGVALRRFERIVYHVEIIVSLLQLFLNWAASRALNLADGAASWRKEVGSGFLP